MPYRSPPAGRLATALTLDDATARTLRAVLRGELDPETASPRTAAWVRQCYHRPCADDLIQHAADALAGTHGVEFVERDDGGPADRPALAYLNAGDTYSPTLVFVGDTARLSTLGDEIEAMERRGVRVR